MHYCIFKGDKGKKARCAMTNLDVSFQESYFSWIVSRNLIFAYHYSLQKIRSFNLNGWLRSQAVKFEFLKINKNLFYRVAIMHLANKSNFLPL